MNVPGVRILLLEIFFSFLLSTVVYGEMDVVFSPDTDLRRLVIDNIARCRSRLDLAISDLNSGELVQALLDARSRGVKVRLVVDYRLSRSESSRVSFLQEEGFPIKALTGRAGGRMNDNFAIFDDRLLATGTYGWTDRAVKYSHEDVLLVDDPSIIASYRSEFDHLYGEEDHLPQLPSRTEPAGNVTESENVMNAPAGKIPSARDIPLPAAALTDREFVDVTIEELDMLFGSQSVLSRKQKKLRWQDYRGKYVRWNGVVVYRGITRYDWYKVGLSFEIGGEAQVLVLFRPEYQRQIVRLKKGDVIAYIARLDARKGLGALYRLDDGEMLGKLIKKAPER